MAKLQFFKVTKLTKTEIKDAKKEEPVTVNLSATSTPRSILISAFDDKHAQGLARDFYENYYRTNAENPTIVDAVTIELMSDPTYSPSIRLLTA